MVDYHHQCDLALVALVEESFQRCSASDHSNSRKLRDVISVVSLPDPSSGDDREYLLVDRTDCGDGDNNTDCTKDVYELQAIPTTPATLGDDPNFASFLVGSRVVSNGQLYVVTRVDPLFWILYLHSPSEEESNAADKNNESPGCNITKSSSKWQPLDQMMEHDISHSVIRSTVVYVKEQLQHIYETTEMDLGDATPTVFYKFSVAKSLAWLQRKQERVYQVLLAQQLQQKQQQTCRSKQDGMYSATFQCEEEEENNKCKDESLGAEATNSVLEQAAKEESVQVICNYLTPAWQTLLLQRLSFSDEVLMSAKQRKQQQERKRKLEGESNGESKKSATTAMVSATNVMELYITGQAQNVVTPKSGSKKPTPQSMGNKQLAKVNKKGMKSLGSFFQAKKK